MIIAEALLALFIGTIVIGILANRFQHKDNILYTEYLREIKNKDS